MAIGNFWPCASYEGTTIDDISGADDDASIGTGTWLSNQSIGMSNLLIEDNLGVVTGTTLAQTINCKGSGDYIDTGFIVDGSISDFSIAMAFEMDDNFDVPRYLFMGGTSIDSLNIYQIGVRTIAGRVGTFDIPPTVLSNLAINAIVVNYDLSAQTITFAFDGDSIGATNPTTFNTALNTSMIIGVGASLDPANSWNNLIGEGYIKNAITTEEEWQTFWSGLND